MINYVNMAVLRLSARRTLTNPGVFLLLFINLLLSGGVELLMMAPTRSPDATILSMRNLRFPLLATFLIYSSVEIFDFLKPESLHFFVSKLLSKRQYFLSVYAGIVSSAILVIVLLNVFSVVIALYHNVDALAYIDRPDALTMLVSAAFLFTSLFLLISMTTNSRIVAAFLPAMLFVLLMAKYEPNPTDVFILPISVSLVTILISMLLLWVSMKIANVIDV